MVQVIWSEIAVLDVEEIEHYIATEAPMRAKAFVGRILEKTRLLSENPRMGTMLRELKKPSIRQLLEGNYRIIYEIISTERIEVLRVIHRARLTPRL